MKYHKMFHLHGIRYESRKDPRKKRQDLIGRIIPGDKLDLERFEYKGEPALMVIEPKTGLDIGVVPAEEVEKFLPYLNDPFYVDVIECYYFDDDSDECGLKLQFCVLTDSEWEDLQKEAERLAMEEQWRKEQPFYKKKWFIVVMVILAIVLISGMLKSI